MAVRQIFGVVGAIVGYVVGGPQGAMYGWQIGSAFGNAWDPQVYKGPSIGDLGQQTAQEGGPRPIVFGLSPPIAGNVIATGQPRIVKRQKSQGKGGPKVEYESVFRTYAIGVCEGPINRFVRVWRNGELVWSSQEEEDLNYGTPPPGESLIHFLFRLRGNALKFEEKADFFLGGFDQVASPLLEEVIGVGETPAFRGTAYMLVKDDDVTDFRGAIPQYLFQVERCEGEFVTSKVYAIEDVESMHVGVALVKDSAAASQTESMHMAGGLVSGELRDQLNEYQNGVADEMHMLGALQSGTHEDVLVTYSNGVADEMHMLGALQSGTHESKLITYQNWPHEEMHMTGSLQSGSLT